MKNMKNRIGTFVLTACAVGILYTGWLSTAKAGSPPGGLICLCAYDVDCQGTSFPSLCYSTDCDQRGEFCQDNDGNPCDGLCFGN